MSADRILNEPGPDGTASPGGLLVHHGSDPTPPALRGAVVAIGNFDGVHRGHRHLVETAIGEAHARGRPAAALTFEPHPRTYFAPQEPHFDLTALPVKLRLFRRLGLDGAIVLPFDAELARTSAQSFVSDRLIGAYGASSVVVGGDFHFGRGREGTPETLARMVRAHGAACTVVDLVSEGASAISSSRIRTALAEGDIEAATAMLGYRWLVAETVRHGDKRGRTLGYPTANLRLPEGCRLRHGIYAVRARLADGSVRGGVASFGRRPTFDDGAPRLEAHLFDYAGDLYGQTLEVEFVGWIRAEERFESVDALVHQMDRDSEVARRLLARPLAHDVLSLIG